MTDKELPYSASSGSMGGDGWSVEVRIEAYAKPIPIGSAGEFMVTTQWQRLPFQQAPIGVPAYSEYQGYLGYTNYLNYPAAQALRWWFHAEIAKQTIGLGVQSRLVKHQITVEHKVTAVSVHCEIGGEDRSSIMPDWGKKPEALPSPEAS